VRAVQFKKERGGSCARRAGSGTAHGRTVAFMRFKAEVAMSDPDLDELAAELSDLPAREPGDVRRARSIIAIEDIQRSSESMPCPQHGEDRDIFERLYAVRSTPARASGVSRPA